MNILVVPTNREEQIQKFLKVWKSAPFDKVIVVEDNPEPTFDIPTDVGKVFHYSWQDIGYELGSDAWVIPRRTDCIRSYGFLKAKDMGAKVIITLDDDCFPTTRGAVGFVEEHVAKLNEPTVTKAWHSTIGGLNMYPRGLPYVRDRTWYTYINTGLWYGVPDLDAVGQLSELRRGKFDPSFHTIEGPSCPGDYFPMCGMNLSFKVEALPMMYFLLMGEVHQYGKVYKMPFDRIGDIWCGLFAKRVCDHLRIGMKFGDPCVHHSRASDPFINLVKEAPGVCIHENLWQTIDSRPLNGYTIGDAYGSVAAHVSTLRPYLYNEADKDYWSLLGGAMRTWLRLSA